MHLFFKMKKISILLFLLVGLNVCFGQEKSVIYGYISDSSTNKPIEFVNVALLNPDSSFVAGIVTDSLGNFIFNENLVFKGKEYILQATHICYDKQLVKFLFDPTGKAFQIQMSPSSRMISEINVEGIRTKVRNRLNFEYVVTDKMKENVMRTSKLLENVPTVFVDYNRTIHIKGSSNILILKNGIELTDNTLVDQIPPETVQKIDIMYNIPSEYANQNYSAIMNIITKRDRGFSVLLDNNISFDGEMYDSKVNIGLETEKHSLYLFYKLYYRNLKAVAQDFTKSTTGSILLDNSYITTPRKECDNEFFYGYSFHSSEKLQVGIDGYLSLYRENNVIKYDNLDAMLYARFKEKYNTQNYMGYVNYTDDQSKIKLNVAYNNTDIDDGDTYYGDANVISQSEYAHTYNAKVSYERNINTASILYMGVKYSHAENKGRYFNTLSDISENYHCNMLVGYAEYIYNIGDKWILDAGMTLQKYHRSFTNDIKVQDFQLFPKFNISYSWKEQNNLSLGYSSYLNDPNLWQMLSFTKKESTNIYTKGNPYLKSEEKSMLSLEYSYSRGNTYFATSAYLRHKRNMIENVVIPKDDYTLIEYTNVHKGRDYGIDVTLSCKLFNWWGINFYGDVFYRNIPSNIFYKKNMFSYSAQIQSNWTITPKITAIVQYGRNEKELAYNGYIKSFDSSTAMLSYNLNDYLSLYLIYVQPFSGLKSHSEMFYSKGGVERLESINPQKLLLSFTFSLSKGKKQSKKETYRNENKKY